MGKDTESAGSKAAGFVFGAGMFATAAAVCATPLMLVGLVVSKTRKKLGLDQAWSSTGSGSPTVARAEDSPNPAVVRRKLESIRRTDPDFSVVLFEDFLAALYTVDGAHARVVGDRGCDAAVSL
jgi:hypothetical protein